MGYKRQAHIRMVIGFRCVFLLTIGAINASENNDYNEQESYVDWRQVTESPRYFAHETDTDRLRIDTVETVYHPIDWSKYTLTEGTLEQDFPVAGKRDRYKLIPVDQRLMPLYFEYQEESRAFQAHWLPKPTVFLSATLKYYWDAKKNHGYFFTKMKDDPQGGHYRALVCFLK